MSEHDGIHTTLTPEVLATIRQALEDRISDLEYVIGHGSELDELRNALNSVVSMDASYAAFDASLVSCDECNGKGWSQHSDGQGREWLGECQTCLASRNAAREVKP